MRVRNILLGTAFLYVTAANVAAETYKEAYTKGMKEFKARKFKESAATLEAAAKQGKTPTEKYNAILYQGFSLNKQRKFMDAAKIFEDLGKVEKLTVPQKNNAFNQYIHNIYWARKYDQVFAIATKACADDKATLYVKSNCAYLACLAAGNIKKYNEKIKWAKKLIELNPKGTWYDRALIYQSSALRGLKKYDEAKKLLSEDAISKMHPHRQGEAHAELGNAELAMKKYPEAIVEFTKIYELPKAHPAHKGMAVGMIIETYNSVGDLEKAEVWMEKLDTIKHKYWNGRGHLRAAQLYEKKGKLEEAKKHWEACAKAGTWWKKLAKKQIAVIDKKLKAKK